MSFSLVCTHCSARLNTPNRIEIGKSVICPKCKNKFQVEEVIDNSESSIGKIPATKTSSGKIPTANVVRNNSSGANSKNRSESETANSFNFEKKSSPSRDEEDDEDSNERQSRKSSFRRSESNRQRDDEESGEQRSFAKGKKIERNRDDEERDRFSDLDDDSENGVDTDEEIRPKKKKKPDGKRGSKKKKSSSPNWPLIGGLVGGVLIVIVAILLLFKGSSSNSELMAFIPANTIGIGGLKFTPDLKKSIDESFNKIPGGMEIFGQNAPFKALNLKMADVEEAVFFIPSIQNVAESDQKAGIAIKLNKSQEISEIKKDPKVHDSELNGHHFYQIAGEIYFMIPEDKILLIASSPTTMGNMIDAKNKSAKFSDNINQLTNKISDGDFWVVFDKKSFDSQIGVMKNALTQQGMTELANGLSDLNAVGMNIKMNSSNVHFQASMSFNSSSVADKTSNELKNAWEKQFKPLVGLFAGSLPPEAKNLFDNLKFSSSGTVSYIEIEFDKKVIEALEKSQNQMLGSLNGGQQSNSPNPNKGGIPNNGGFPNKGGINPNKGNFPNVDNKN